MPRPRPRHINKVISKLSIHPSCKSHCFDSKLVVVVVVIGLMETRLKANFDDQFSVKTKQLAGRMTAQPPNRFVFSVVVVEFAVNGNRGLIDLKQAFQFDE